MEENPNVQEEIVEEVEEVKETETELVEDEDFELPKLNLPKVDLSKIKLPKIKLPEFKKTESAPKQTKRVRLKKSAKILLAGIAALILVLVGMLTIPGMVDRNNLKKLGYSEAAIEKIYELEWEGMILEGGLYSDNLNNSITKESFRKEFIDLYLNTDSLTNDDFTLYSKLILMGYEKSDVLAMFNSLEFWEMTPLLVFDYVENVSAYMRDVDTHRVVNSQSAFTLSGNYITYYAETEPVENEGSIEMNVNKRFYLSSDYVPGSLENMSVVYASKGLTLNAEAYEAFKQMCDAAKTAFESKNPVMYASSAYRDYTYQADLYDTYVRRYGEEEADTIAARPGHSEHQTGLTVDIASTTNGGLSKFGESQEYQWMLSNAHKYGWILRYPEGKEDITGYSAEPWHWRYVGVDLATKIYNSKLTFDEYYMLYMVD